jgi:hypothetical protein
MGSAGGIGFLGVAAKWAWKREVKPTVRWIEGAL